MGLKTGPQPELACWEFAGLLLTYWCNARCAFCYLFGGPDRGGEMSAARAVELWRGLDRLAAAGGKTMRIHLAGGEPFGDWPRLLAVLQAARQAGLTPPDNVETNAFWAADDELTRSRLKQLDALGLRMLVVSADVYHQEFVPLERVRRCVETARTVLGPGRVRVRWWDFYNEPRDLVRAGAAEKRAAFEVALQRHQDRLTGRAALRLPEFLPLHPATHYFGDDCKQAVLGSRHVHIDGYGNIFPGVCSGIILGNAATRAVEQVWQDVASGWRSNPVVEALVSGGSYELLQRAKAFGFEESPEGYANKCHLCASVRQYLFERHAWPAVVGPAECYANEADKQAAAVSTRARPPCILRGMPTIDATKLIDGREVARSMLATARENVARIRSATGVQATLATVLVGDDPASATYVRMKRKRCDDVGMRSIAIELPASTSTEDVVAQVQRLGRDPAVHGILVQHPVPAPIDRRAVFEAIPLEKDVDGVTACTLGRVILGMPAFIPCTPAGIMRLLLEYKVPLKGMQAVVIGRSPILGRPMASLLINAHATVTLCHSHSRNISNIVAGADVVIAAVGQPRFVKGTWIKPGAVVIDAGYNEGNVGDVDFEPALKRAALITPVPGGVGPMTIAVLIQHTAEAAAQQLKVDLAG
jgi:methylenetetrahydrofolate dehydrogenase (NADP+) / methenyltetrahydrofolate cyclohydrolase